MKRLAQESDAADTAVAADAWLGDGYASLRYAPLVAAAHRTRGRLHDFATPARILSLIARVERAEEASEGVSHALESLVDPDMAHADPARAAGIVAEMAGCAVDQNLALVRWVAARRALTGVGRPQAGTMAARQAGEEYAAAEDALYALAAGSPSGFAGAANVD